MKNYLLFIVIAGLFSCGKKASEDPEELYSCLDETVYDLGHSIRYQNIYGLLDYEEFTKDNHLNGPCGDTLITEIFQIIDLINFVGNEIDLKTGGSDINGKRMAACETQVGGDILININFINQLKKLLKNTEKWSSNSEHHFEMVKRLKDDVRILTGEYYSEEQIKNRKVIEIILDLNNAKMKLLFSETIMFEMLKSHGLC